VASTTPISTRLSNLESFPGRGIQGLVDGVLVQVGSAHWLGQHDRNLPSEGPGDGQLGVWVGLDGTVRAIAVFEDPIRPGAAGLVERLFQEGLAVSMVTGDQPGGAGPVARQLGITTVRAGCQPGDKLDWIRSLQARGTRVAFVGDGVNDGPVLAAANVGIGLASGSDLARVAGQVTLVGDDLGQVWRAIGWARATWRNIHFNLFWAALYNLLLIPLATGMFEPLWGWELQPAWGGAAMALSSVTVVWSANRLRLEPTGHATRASGAV
jgi:Cu+-exporting ATPase